MNRFLPLVVIGTIISGVFSAVYAHKAHEDVYYYSYDDFCEDSFVSMMFALLFFDGVITIATM